MNWMKSHIAAVFIGSLAYPWSGDMTVHGGEKLICWYQGKYTWIAWGYGDPPEGTCSGGTNCYWFNGIWTGEDFDSKVQSCAS
jgi:hypothetical protein